MKSNRTLSPVLDALGLLALAATLLLASPGVQIARAADSGEPAAVSIDPVLAAKTAPLLAGAKKPATCENPGEALLDDALLENQLRDLVRRAAAQQRLMGPQSSEHGIVLNSRGYNYRPTPLEEPGA